MVTSWSLLDCLAYSLFGRYNVSHRTEVRRTVGTCTTRITQRLGVVDDGLVWSYNILSAANVV